MGPLLVVTTSATAPIVVLTVDSGSVPSLLPEMGSGVTEVLFAVFLTLVRVTGGTKPIDRVTVVPLAIAIPEKADNTRNRIVSASVGCGDSRQAGNDAVSNRDTCCLHSGPC